VHIGDWGARGAMYWPGRIALVDEARGTRFTYADLDRRSDALAAHLRSLGIGNGDRVGAIAHNGVEVMDLLFACGKLGAIFVPYNWRLTAHEAAGLVRLTTPRALFVSRELADVAIGALEAAGLTGERAIPFVDLGSASESSSTYERIVTADSAPVREESTSAEDTFVLLFTGGTTGLPKAVKLSHRMVACNVQTTVIHHLRHDDVTIVHTPMFHTGGLFVHALPVLATGGRVILVRRWDAGEMLRLIVREKVTVSFAVPTQLRELSEHAAFATTDFSAVRMLISGGAPLPVSLLATFQARGVPIAQGFGMTEFGPNALMLTAEEGFAHPGAVGRPNYFVDARVVGPDNRPVTSGDTGELCFRGQGLFSGYFGMDERVVDDEGWFHTGDLAREQSGNLYIVGRLKEMFISGGENVYPLEVEEALYAHPAVRSCAVIGIPDERWGEVGCAFVIWKEGARDSATADELRAFCKERLAGYKVPKQFQVVQELPLTPAGKILKRELLRRFTKEACS
jgi:fatty-acyl-CoA synthase